MVSLISRLLDAASKLRMSTSDHLALNAGVNEFHVLYWRTIHSTTDHQFELSWHGTAKHVGAIFYADHSNGVCARRLGFSF